MYRPGNRLLVWFLIFSFVFFVVAVIVEEFALFDSNAEVRPGDPSGSLYEQDAATNGPADVSASGARFDGHPALSGRPLRLVTTTWSPFAGVPGKPRFALDLVEAALERMGIGVDTVVMDEERLSSVLLTGGFDGSAAVWQNEARKGAMIYSRPYLENRLILVGRTGSDVSAASLAGLDGTKVALVAGLAYASVDVTEGGPEFVRSNSDEGGVARLLNGEVDYALLDDLVVQYLISNHGDEARTRLVFGSTPLLARSLHLAVRRSLPEADAIITRFDAEVSAMIADRTYNGLLELDWIRADVDGDGLGEYVPYGNRTGPDPPAHFYELFLSDRPAMGPGMTRRYFLDGSIYEDWSAVPGRYKAVDAGRAGSDPQVAGSDPRVAGSFSFTW
ncbi:MAG: amino acid ABC transporter substrate-binding protein [Gemmatimonadetes bacterium]|nr:amino acid ABC transporter substrate-binding protein [Gemmatimonadota bacterium]MYG86843.1 amino acid ABC transporter substrate-binding protein [Gemmatimonadota bacterium]MYJ89253.1 amino acid ABC transporter substrate-binding protein [Gemmatimonadota bacterium]